MEDVFARIPAQDYLAVLQRFVDQGLPPEKRNPAEDLVWASQSWPSVSKRTRREVAEALEAAAPYWSDPDGLIALINRRLVDSSSDWLNGRPRVVDLVRAHLIRDRDWTALDFFQQLGALECGDRRFSLFLEELLSGDVSPDEARLQHLAAAAGRALQAGGLDLAEIDPVEGYPAFQIKRTGAGGRPPRLILFASRGTKPDIRMGDVLDVNIEVLTKEDKVLLYDRPIDAAGLLWRDLQAWWAEATSSTSDDAAKTSLWKRLLTALPDASPPQRALFEGYHRIYGSEESFPALLPEVWVHWDPLTVQQRGEDAFRTQRMDFLLLLQGNRRVVLEVDGQQHYSEDGRPSPQRYARTMQGDRDLRLSGYEVYRFAAHELFPDTVDSTIREFFDRLLTG